MAAKNIAGIAPSAIREKKYCTVVLAGGETPRGLYEALASKRFRNKVDWSKVYIFFGDERCVAPSSKLSNYRMVREVLLAKVPIPRENIFRIRGELQPAGAAKEYERKIRLFYARCHSLEKGDPALDPRFCGDDKKSDKERDVDIPSFDLVLLGLGKDGHVASLFPKSKALKEKKRWVVPVYEKTAVPPHRVTMILPVINNAKNIWFLVAGSEKQEILKKVLKKGRKYPAQLIRPRKGKTVWFINKTAVAE